jgi:hypothetical protein
MLVGNKGSCHGAKPLSPTYLDIQSKFLAIPAFEDAVGCSSITLGDQFAFWLPMAVVGRILASGLKLDRCSHLSTRHERERLFWKNMHEKRDINTSRFCGGECLMPVKVGGNQAIAIHNNPLARVFGTVHFDPVHFRLPVA